MANMVIFKGKNLNRKHTPELRVVKAYRVDGHNKTYYFASLRGAMNKIAWWRIFRKFTGEISKFPKRLECTCKISHIDYYDPSIDTRHCEVHNRETGYLKRLHGRYVNFIMSILDPEDFPKFFNEVIE